MASEKRCHYEVLGLSRDCTADEIRSAYKKLALQRHPDKLVQSGLSQAEATARFQELAQAYEVLSDPKERAWYDSHRSQILFADSNPSTNSTVPNLFSFFSNTVYSGYSDSGRGFFKVYSDLFSKIYANELDFASKLGLGRESVRQAPAMGNLESPYAQVSAFYNYWLGFSSVMDFFWVDQYDAMAGLNRKSRRVMEEENKKARKKARREYNETVRGLAEFVKKRDKRVIDMALKRNLEMERKRVLERERKRELERERMERVRAYVEPDWAQAEEVEEEEEEEEERKAREGKELYCVVCGKKFKSEKQWKNHEQSKKHKEKVAEFRDSIGDEGVQVDDGVGQEKEEEETVADELGERIRDGLEIEGEENGDELYEVEDGDGDNGNDDDDDDDDEEDEMGVLEAMVAGHKNRKNVGLGSEGGVEDDESDGVGFMEYNNRKSTRRSRGGKKEKGTRNGGEAMRDATSKIDSQSDESDGNQNSNLEESSTRFVENEFGSEGRVEDDESNGVEFMEYNNRKSTRRSRGGKKEKGKRNGGEAMRDATDKIDSRSDESDGNQNSNLEESSTHCLPENESNGNGKGDNRLGRSKKVSDQAVDQKGTGKKDTNAKSKNSSKQKKAKAASKNSSNLCEACGEEFESRNKLHKHLGETGHAALKYR
ncbi:DNAJ protein JJJ1 homolog [Alnus glutinosa]|uniref:DNAJ protein JJJ1 homolog n=1 Tax=Alnus glutinosa TaxID=3517 RepID=UPI002D783C7A|nr:DNAJ protein JJJ1 homolog [Alnus glutinosa]